MSKRGLSPAPTPRPYKKRRLALTPAQTQDVRAIAKKEVMKEEDIKYTDVHDSSAVNSAGYITALTGALTRGDFGLNSFEGNWVKPKGLTIRYKWSTNQEYSNCRTIIFQWNDFSTPNIINVLQNTSIGADVCISDFLTDTKSQLRVLHDSLDTVNNQAGVVGTLAFSGMARKVYIPGSRMSKIHFVGTSNVQTSGTIWFLAVSDDILLVAPSVAFYSRISYTD